MKKLNKYQVYIDNGQQTTNRAMTASSKKAVMKALEGQGEIVVVKNLNDEHPILTATVREALQASGQFDRLEVEWIIQTLTMTGIATDENPAPQPEAKTDAPPEAKPEKKPKTRKSKTETRPDAPKPMNRADVKPDVKPMEEKKSA